MPGIHYFQRYSSVENTVTNNTLQLLARIYDHSPVVASQLLTDITGTSIEIGLEIAQQQRTGNAVPDGVVLQRSFKIVIETKVDASVDLEQLVRHAGTFTDERQRILLLLTKQALGQAEERNIGRRIHEAYPAVIFRAVTYGEICRALPSLFKEHETTMIALVQDYIAYCNEANLLDLSRYLLRIVPCGETVHLNRQYGIYFQPSDRGYTDHAFIGIYAQKTVQAVIQVESVYDVDHSGGSLQAVLVQGENTHRFDDKILAIVHDATTQCGYDLQSGHRFFCGSVADTQSAKYLLVGFKERDLSIFVHILTHQEVQPMLLVP